MIDGSPKTHNHAVVIPPGNGLLGFASHLLSHTGRIENALERLPECGYFPLRDRKTPILSEALQQKLSITFTILSTWGAVILDIRIERN